MAVNVDKDACISCGSCIDECPMEALTLTDEGAQVNADECTECGACVSACAVDALSL